ncbi:MAG: patatin-like phospholipase family protein [Betaproteobacteria bacterium]|nr:patatin-like phospholipase family protein [Betaproteobacteria bacterium]MDH5221750.1 patatin-like phospholipase family protein [Betaproteobacteria bacterium]MDH5351229.1 patatin-like phospholipase family protein [Betaproteobacteria bacterium]
MNRFPGVLAPACLAALLALQPCARAEAQPTAPRIGLALSGGGARGLAHVGVLKVLEELRVPVHCVTGTSMGSIVAGAYASGTTPAALEKFVRETDWDRVFSDRPPRAEVAIQRKFEDYKTLFAPEFGVTRKGIALPKGVVAGVAIEGFLRSLVDPTVGVIDFDKLPIPYRAVAADIETGEAVVLRRGSLPQAMRASMSVPGALAPVEIDGRLLVDGGIADNLPIDLTRKLCADVVIAVNISTPPLKRSEITSALSVSGQLINFLGKVHVDNQLKSLGARDVLIAPELGDITSGSFDRAADAIRVGEDAARAMTAQLQRYSLPPEQYAALRRTQVRKPTGLGVVQAIRFEGLKRTSPKVLESLVDSKPGVPLTEEVLSADLRRIYGRGDFEGIDYVIEDAPEGRTLVIRPREKEWGPDYLRFGLGLASDVQGDSIFNVLVQYRRTWLNRLGAEWITEGQMGNTTYLATTFYQPVHERGVYFVAPYARVGEAKRAVFRDEERIADYLARDSRMGLDGGANLGTWGEVRLGAMWRRVDGEVETGAAILPATDEVTAGMRARIVADQLDHAWFPSSGFRFRGSAYVADDSFGSDRNYKRVEAEALYATHWGAHTFSFYLSGGSDLDTTMPAYETFTLGGPLQLSGYRIQEFSGQRYGFGRLMYYNRTVPLPDLLGSGVYLGASLEAGQVHGRPDGGPDTGTMWGGSLFLGANTFAGPAYVGLGFGEGGRFSMYLLIGAPSGGIGSL